VEKKFHESTDKGMCMATRTFNVVESDSVSSVTEVHVNNHCVAGGAIAVVGVVTAPITVPTTAIGTVATTAVACVIAVASTE